MAGRKWGAPPPGPPSAPGPRRPFPRLMALARLACWACVAMLALLAGDSALAQAGTKHDDILVLGADGGVRAPRPPAAELSEAKPPRRAAGRTTKARKSKKKT